MIGQDVDDELPEHGIVDEGWRSRVSIFDESRDVKLLLLEQVAFVEDVCSDRNRVDGRHVELVNQSIIIPKTSEEVR